MNSAKPKSLPQLNKFVRMAYPKLIIAKSEDCFYVTSNDPDTALMLAGLYTTSICVYKVHHLSFKQWLESVEAILKQKENE